MSAKRKGTIGAIVGTIICALIIAPLAFVSFYEGFHEAWLFLLVIPFGAVYGFGIVFGWARVKGWFAKVCGVTVSTSILYILFSRDRRTSFVTAFTLSFFVIGFGFVWGYLIGIFIGVKQIKAEQKQNNQIIQHQ